LLGYVARPAESSFGGGALSLRKFLLGDVARPAESSFGGGALSLRKFLLGEVARPAESSFWARCSVSENVFAERCGTSGGK